MPDNNIFPLYNWFRGYRPIYNFLYKYSNYNHEAKILHQKLSRILSVFDFLFLAVPLLFIAQHKIWPVNPLLSELFKQPVLNSLYAMFTFNGWLFSLLSFSLYSFSRLYRSTYKVYQNDNEFVYGFHYLAHNYRDFINETIKFKRKYNILRPIGFEGEHKEFLTLQYTNQIKTICIECQRILAKIINDNDCYISIKLLESIDAQKAMLRHYGSFPDEHMGHHINNVKVRIDDITKPDNLFELILKRFNETKRSWDLGIVFNDLRGHENFDASLIKNDFSKYKASIIIPITIDYKIVGFFCFNSNRIGMLREKHRNFLSGHCDMVASILRNILGK